MPALYKRVLVPLDGSLLAEGAIRHAFAIAESAGAELTLLYVVEPISDLLTMNGHALYVDEQLEGRTASAREYLDRARHRIAGRDVKVHVAVESGPPAEKILDHARAESVDLIVMATHGRSGVKRWLLGSVANKVLQRAEVPVLLVPARDRQP
jgi:nucleotide-binding universal stress UspA family protein